MGKSKPGVYTLTHKDSNQVYVGSTDQLNDRIGVHRWHLEKGKHPNPILQKIFDEAVSEAFSEIFDVEKIPTADRETAYLKEQETIDALKDTGRLLNRALDVKSPGKGIGVSEQGRRRLSEAAVGRRLSDETKEKLSAAHKGKTISSEQRVMISKQFKGVPKTPEHAAKAGAGHWKSVECEGVVYPSLKAFAEAKGLSMATASRRAKKLRNG